MQHIEHLLPWGSPGIERRLSVFRFGSGPRKAYIQASLHADELPGMRVAVELKKRLRELEQEGRLNATIELVPVANPASAPARLYWPKRPAAIPLTKHAPPLWLAKVTGSAPLRHGRLLTD